MYRKLDDRVTRWATINEPWVVSDGGYLHGDAYTAYFDSRAFLAWGVTGMLLTDAALTTGAIVVLLLMLLITGRGRVTSPSA